MLRDGQTYATRASEKQNYLGFYAGMNYTIFLAYSLCGYDLKYFDEFVKAVHFAVLEEIEQSAVDNLLNHFITN